MKKATIFLKGIEQGFRNFSHMITDIVNFILLSLVYFIGIGFVSIIAKLSGKHFVDMKFKGSTWVGRNLKKGKIEQYYRMF